MTTTFLKIVNNDKYISSLTDRQLEVFDKGVTIANNIRTSFNCGHKNIQNKYEAKRKDRTPEPKAQLQDSATIINEIHKLKDHFNKILPVNNANNPDSVSKKDTRKAALANDAKVTKQAAVEEKPKQTRRNTPERIEEIKKLVEVYWKKAINGEWVTQKDVAKQKFPKEPNILSKKDAKPFMKKISEQVKMAKAKHGSIRNFDNRTRAALLTYIHDILKK